MEAHPGMLTLWHGSHFERSLQLIVTLYSLSCLELKKLEACKVFTLLYGILLYMHIFKFHYNKDSLNQHGGWGVNLNHFFL